MLDDFRIYNFALSDSEIASLAKPSSPDSSLAVNKSSGSVAVSWQMSDPAQMIELSSNLLSEAQWRPISSSSFQPNIVYELKTPGTNSSIFYRFRGP